MLSSDITGALAAGKSPLEIASQFTGKIMEDPKLLKAELQGSGPMSRKRFCEFQGAGNQL